VTLSIRPIVAALASHVAAGGYCNQVTGHEPKGAPGGPGDVVAAVWFQTLTPTGANSSLIKTDVLLTFTARFYVPMLSEPQDEIDPRVTDAMVDLMDRVNGDFTLGGTCDYVDLLGQHGQALSAQAGYLEISRALQRVVDVTIPVVVLDVWTQTR
jgi:hypothetical protein